MSKPSTTPSEIRAFVEQNDTIRIKYQMGGEVTCSVSEVAENFSTLVFETELELARRLGRARDFVVLPPSEGCTPSWYPVKVEYREKQSRVRVYVVLYNQRSDIRARPVDDIHVSLDSEAPDSEDGGGSASQLEATVLDLSVGGIGVSAREKFEEGERLFLTFEDHVTGWELDARGEILYVSDTPDPPKRKRYGIQFLDMDDDQKRKTFKRVNRALRNSAVFD